MPEEYLKQWRECGRKIRFKVKKKALAMLSRIGKGGVIVPENAIAYECRHCAGWHLGHRPGSRPGMKGMTWHV